VKLTGLGLKLDYDLCRENLESVVHDAARRNNFVRIDMEDSSTTDDTLRLYRELREAGHENLGVVLQAYLRRTLDDIHSLADLRPSVRICKGIYVEPPELAYQGYEEVRANFIRALEALLDADCYVGIATHDEWLVSRAAGSSPGAAWLATSTSSRCSMGLPSRSATGSSAKVTGCASTCRSASTGTPTRCAGCRRTRRSPVTSPRTRWGGLCLAATAPLDLG
jgi:hypothetical protein